MNMDFLQKKWIKGMIAHNKVFIVMVLIDLFHSLLHPLFELDGRTSPPSPPPSKELFIIQLDSNISKNWNLALHEKNNQRTKWYEQC